MVADVKDDAIMEIWARNLLPPPLWQFLTLEIFTHLDRVDELICEENILHF